MPFSPLSRHGPALLLMIVAASSQPSQPLAQSGSKEGRSCAAINSCGNRTIIAANSGESVGKHRPSKVRPGELGDGNDKTPVRGLSVKTDKVKTNMEDTNRGAPLSGGKTYPSNPSISSTTSTRNWSLFFEIVAPAIPPAVKSSHGSPWCDAFRPLLDGA